MGNELNNEYIDKEPEDYENSFIRYGVICQKWGEKNNEDSYLSLPNLSFSNKDKRYYYSLFGVFDGHNSDYVPKYLSKNIQKFYEKEISTINKDNYKKKIEEIFKSIDKELREDKKEKKENDVKQKDEKEKENKENNNIINENEEENKDINKEKKEDINYLDNGVDEKELNIIKNTIKSIKDLPNELKEVDDSEIEDLLIFKNLFKCNNNYIYNNMDVNYIGSSASMVLITNDSIITADLGITKCILLNKDGNILNNKDNTDNNSSNSTTKDFNDKESLNSRDTKDTSTTKNSKNSKNTTHFKGHYKDLHTFNNLEEKKRIKKFHKTIDYQNLTINFYVPASRCFGLFKYKDNEILKEEDQIISCIPEVYIYDKKDVDFILLFTKGAFPSYGESFKNFKEKIKILLNDNNNNQKIKLSEYINEYVKNKKEEEKKNYIRKKALASSNIPNKSILNSIYVGKEDFGEDNALLNELNKTYYKDITSLNNNNNCNENYNTTCILIQLLQKGDITDTGDTLDEEKKSETIEEKKEINVNENPLDNKGQSKNENQKNDEFKKENDNPENTQEVVKNENEKNNIIDINNVK